MDQIPVSNSLVKTALTMLVRQALLWLSGVYFSGSVLDGDTAQAVAAAMVFVGVTTFGQVKGWVEHRKSIALANDASIGVVVQRTHWFRDWLRSWVA